MIKHTLLSTKSARTWHELSSKDKRATKETYLVKLELHGKLEFKKMVDP